MIEISGDAETAIVVFALAVLLVDLFVVMRVVYWKFALRHQVARGKDLDERRELIVADMAALRSTESLALDTMMELIIEHRDMRSGLPKYYSWLDDDEGLEGFDDQMNEYEYNLVHKMDDLLESLGIEVRYHWDEEE